MGINTRAIDREARETIIDAAKYYDHFELINLMGVSYEGICDLKEKMEKAANEKLASLLSSKLVDIYNSQPFDFQASLDYLSLLYTPKSFKKALRLGRLRYNTVSYFIDCLEKEYKADDEDDWDPDEEFDIDED